MTGLTALAVKRETRPGRHTDGGSGLILQVAEAKSGGVSKSWLLRFALAGRRREMGLGRYPAVSLSDARAAAAEARALLSEGQDPIEARRRAVRERQREAASVKTFEECAMSYLEAHEGSWKNPKHRQQWRNTLKTYVYPVVGDHPVAEITVDDVLTVLKPIWYEKSETASRVRGRIEAILAFAIAKGLRPPPNPAIWRGQLDALLPPKSRIAPVKHHTALPFEELPAFYAELRNRRAVSAKLLRFIILTAARSGEARGARWGEIDLDTRIWSVPAERTKTRAEHRVPLTDDMVRLIGTPKAAQELIFPSQTTGRQTSDAVFRALFARMGRPELMAHGFRSTFRDWCGEATEAPRELAEHALAHRVGSAVELAYRRGDALERRRKLMADWTAFTTSGG